MFHPSCYALLMLLPMPQAKAPKADPCPDVMIVVFRHELAISDAARKDKDVIFKAIGAGYTYVGGGGRGYELSIHARDLGRWKGIIENLHKSGTLKYYDQWGLDRNGYGLVPVYRN